MTIQTHVDEAVTEEKPGGKKIKVPLGYSKSFTPEDDNGAVRECIGNFTELTFHTKILGDCAEIEILGNDKGALASIHFEFGGPPRSIHRLPRGGELWILAIDDNSVTFVLRRPI